MLLERGVTPWDVAHQLGHTDGGQLIMELYGHPSEAGTRARLLAAWDSQAGLVPLRGPQQNGHLFPDAGESGGCKLDAELEA
ncbi:MAG TPA: hypothetical protein VGN08_12340 [Solirubrobacteraceae bacterium]|jgi:hypothetical protein